MLLCDETVRLGSQVALPTCCLYFWWVTSGWAGCGLEAGVDRPSRWWWGAAPGLHGVAAGRCPRASPALQHPPLVGR